MPRILRLILWMTTCCLAACSPQTADPGRRMPLDIDAAAGTLSGEVRGSADEIYQNDAGNDVKKGDADSGTADSGKLPVNDRKNDAQDDEKSADGDFSVPDICRNICPSEQISVEDPSLIATYAPDELGIVALCGDAAANPDCLSAALRDGAQVVSKTKGRLTLLYPSRLESFLDAAAERIDTPAIEGRWSVTQNRIIPGVSGRKLDIKESTSNFISAVQNSANTFALKVDDIPALSADISGVENFVPNVAIGTYRTKFSRARNRTHNVKLAASAVDGLFLMPGAEFSYNDWVGERSEARGFKEAPVIEQGQMVEGLGGGACQVSSTIHAAALLSGLEILERSNHSLPSSYIPKGMDAVVSYPLLDLRVKNTYPRPVVLRVTTEDNILTAEFLSDVPQTKKIYMRREAAAEIPYKEVITVDPALEPGTIKITKRGKVGYKMLRSRLMYDNGVELFEKFYDDIYQPQTQQVSIAPDVIYPPPETVPDEDGFAAP